MNLKYLSILFPALLLLFSGCQEDGVEITEPALEEAFKGNSDLADLIRRISLKDGSADNIVDHASCLSLALPVTVLVNGRHVAIEKEKDYLQFEPIFDQYDNDRDIIEILFPVTVILPDHSELEIKSSAELKARAAECLENGEDEDIECVDFVYPLEIALYDSESQQPTVLVVGGDKELFQLINQLDDNDFVGFSFPVTLVFQEGSPVEVHNNDELENAIRDNMDDCDEDDDSDYGDDNVDDTPLRTTLIQNEWQITYFFDVTDSTTYFKGFAFAFTEEGKVSAANATHALTGTWETDGSSGALVLKLSFDNDLFKGVSDSWKVSYYTETKIELHTKENENGIVKNLIFQKL